MIGLKLRLVIEVFILFFKLTVSLHRGVTGPSVLRRVVLILIVNARGLVLILLPGTVGRTVTGGVWRNVTA